MNNNDIAVIFDLDGVISDTQDLHASVDSKVLNHFGIKLHPGEITDRFAGAGDRNMFSTLFQEYNIQANLQHVINIKWTMMTELISKSNFQPMPNSIELIHTLKAAGLKLSIGSGSPRHFISSVLNTFSLHQCFECYVSAEEVPRPKPYPDIFLTAASKMRVSPNKCVVIEDGLSGMEAATNAGMSCIGLVKDPLKKYPATAIVTSLANITLDLIKHVKGLYTTHPKHATPAYIFSQETACKI